LNGVGGGVGVLLVVPESTSLLLPPSSVLFFSQQVLGPCAADAFAQVNARHHVACASQMVQQSPTEAISGYRLMYERPMILPGTVWEHCADAASQVHSHNKPQ
jgi:hypothetical protein